MADKMVRRWSIRDSNTVVRTDTSWEGSPVKMEENQAVEGLEDRTRVALLLAV